MNVPEGPCFCWSTAAIAFATIMGGVAAYKAYHRGSRTTRKSCCPPDSLPAQPEDHTSMRYVPRGKCFELPPSGKRCVSSLRVYVVAGKPSSNQTNTSNEDVSWPQDKQCILMSPDMAGMDSGLHKKMADNFADRLDAVIILYDPFGGKPFMIIPASDDGRPQQAGLNWFTVKFVTALLCRVPSIVQANDWETRIKPLFTDQLIPFVQEKLGCSTFSMVGFCYGCWVVMKASSDSDIAPFLQCGVSFHPSVEGVEKKSFGRDDMDLCRQCTVPQMIYATKSEPDSWKPDGTAHRALQSNPYVAEIEFRLAPTTESHGFMTRSDLTNADSARAIEEAMELAVEFVKKHSTGSKHK